MIEFFNDDKTWRITEQRLYSDNTPMIKPGEEMYTEIVREATGVEIRTTGIMELFAGLAFVLGVTASGGHIKTLVLPYIPGARQDRVNPTGDVLCTLGMVGEMIRGCAFDRVIAADPHSHASHIWIDELVAYPLIDIYAHLWKGYDGVIAPDKGGRLRATIAAGVLGKPIVYADKTRDVSTGALTGFAVDVEAGKHYVVVDDICDGGGTFIGLLEKITEQGAYADLFVTHGIFSKGVETLLNAGYKNVYTTDTVDGQYNRRAHKFAITKDMRNFNG